MTDQVLTVYTTTGGFETLETDPFDDYCLDDDGNATARTFKIKVLPKIEHKALIDLHKPSTITVKSKSDKDVIPVLRKAAEDAIKAAELDGLPEGYTVCMNKSEPVGKDWEAKTYRVYAHFLLNGEVPRSKLVVGNKTFYIETAWWVEQN